MNLFKPAYYNMKKDLSQREDALRKEKSKGRLRKVALDQTMDNKLRAIAVARLGDPDVCEAVLMEKNVHYYKDAYHAAAETLGDQSRLERILRECGNLEMETIIIPHLNDQVLLENIAIDEDKRWGKTVSRVAVSCLRSEAVLVRIAVHADESVAKEAARRVYTSEACGEIALNSPHIYARITAAERLPDPSALAGPMRERLLPGILEDPTNETLPIKLLALCGDDLARLLLYCTDHDRFTDYSTKLKYMGNFKFEEDTVSKIDPDELYPALKRIYDRYTHQTVDSSGRENLKRVSQCIRAMHKNGILAERIETEFPQTLKVHYAFMYYYDGYDDRDWFEGDEIMEFWRREG